MKLEQEAPTNVLIIDNGACYAKLEFSSANEPKVIPNCITKAKSERRRPFIGNQIQECRDISGLFYILCFQKGYLTNWDVQKTIWDYMFSNDCLPVNLSETPLLITEPIFNFNSIREAMTEILYEEYDCDKVSVISGPDLAVKNYYDKNPGALCCMIIDIGYSFTHIVPFMKEKKIKEAIRRIDVGGKLLTNHLKDIISYRQLNVMDESYVINQVKEDCCFVSQNFNEDMRIGKEKYPTNTIIREYVLPDFTHIRRGYSRPPVSNKEDVGEFQTIRMNNERFIIPEVLFHPSDIGIHQMGIAEGIIDAVSNCPEETKPHLFENIIVIGGSSLFSGMQDRLQSEIRALAPDDFGVNIKVAKNPITYNWYGGKLYSQSTGFQKSCMSRSEYEENGCKVCLDKIDN